MLVAGILSPIVDESFSSCAFHVLSTAMVQYVPGKGGRKICRCVVEELWGGEFNVVLDENRAKGWPQKNRKPGTVIANRALEVLVMRYSTADQVG
jgi:hypothetical protein